jgi:hypothetical protein
LTVVSEFVAANAMPEKGMKDIKILIGKVYSNKILKRTQIYQNIKEVKEGKKHSYLVAFQSRKKQNALRTTSPLSPPPLKRMAVKLSKDLLQHLFKAKAQSGGFCLRY